MIRPNIGLLKRRKGKNIPFTDRASMEPLQLGVLAGLTPDDIEIKLFDDRFEKIDFNEQTDLVALSVEIFTAKRADEIADEYIKRNVPVVLGGIHVSSVPEEAAKYADSIVVGDAEKVWKKLITDFRKGELKKRYLAPPGVAHPGRIPRRNLYKGKSYLPVSLAQFGRGCPYICSYCATGEYFKGNHFFREIEEIIYEIKHQSRKFLFFIDDNIVGNKEKAKALFKALIPLNIKWIGQASLDMTSDHELMDLMHKSGCIGLVIGFESVTPEGLIDYKKSHNRCEDYEEQIKIIRKYKIHIWAAFVLGHDSETKETLKKTLDFTIKHKFSFAAFNVLMPYPGTSMYEKLKKENRLLYEGKWWLNDNYRFNHAAFKPKNMTHSELTEYSFFMRKKFNSFSNIIKRIFTAHNLFDYNNLYLLVNLLWLFRKEMLKKQSMLLGYKNNGPNRKINKYH